jgi:hypothetical protein
MQPAAIQASSASCASGDDPTALEMQKNSPSGSGIELGSIPSADNFRNSSGGISWSGVISGFRPSHGDGFCDLVVFVFGIA